VLAEERCATSAEAELKAVKEKKNAADTAKIRDDVQRAASDVLKKIGNPRMRILQTVRLLNDRSCKDALAKLDKVDSLARELEKSVCASKLATRPKRRKQRSNSLRTM